MNTIIFIIYAAALVYTWLIVARAVLSWFPARYGSPFFAIKNALHTLTEPYLRLFRRVIPMARLGAVGIDMSAFVGLIVLFIAIQVLARVRV